MGGQEETIGYYNGELGLQDISLGGYTINEVAGQLSVTNRDVHFRKKMQSVIAQKPILTLKVECLTLYKQTYRQIFLAVK